MELNVDKNNYILSKRYAQALIELAINDKSLEAFYGDLLAVLDIYKNNSDFRETLCLPSIEKDKKKDVLRSLMAEKINGTVLKFLYVLIDSNRFNHLETIVYCFNEEKDKRNNVISAQITSSIELNKDIKQNLEKILSNKTNKKVNIKYETDDNLIGGFILTIGERVVDLSLRNKIKNMKKQLI